MLDRSSLAQILIDAVALSDSIYANNGGNPAAGSIAATEVADFDEELAEATGLPRPVFLPYADAEAKLRALNDLVRSAAVLLPRSDTNVGFVNAVRSAIETAARLHWALAPDGDHFERAARLLRERLRGISEISRIDDASRAAMLAFEEEVRVGAAAAGLQVPGPSPGAVDLIVDLLERPGALTIDGLNRQELAGIFYRMPSGSAHATMHGVSTHHPDPALDPSRRATQPEPWEQTLVLIGGLYAGYDTAHRALLKLYGWDARVWDHHVAEAASQITRALDDERAQRQ